MRALVLAILAACGTSTTSTEAAITSSDRWPQFGFDSYHANINWTEAAIDATNVADLHVAWTATTGLAPGDPSVGGGRVYIGSRNNTLYAFDAQTGRRVWRAYAARDVLSTPAAAFGVVAFTSDDGMLYVVDALSGAARWSARIAPIDGLDSARASPVVANGTIYVASVSQLYAFDIAGCGTPTCAPLWTGAIPPNNIGRTPQVTLGGAFAFVHGGSPSNANVVYAFASPGCGAPTCTPAWTYSVGGGQVSSMASFRGHVLVQNENGITGIRSALGDRADIFKPARDWDGYMAFADDILYATSRDGLVYGGLQAFDITSESATPVWRTEAGYARAPVIANGLVYVLMGNPEVLTVYAVGCGTNGATCTPLWQDTAAVGTLDAGAAGTARPIVTGGMVFIGDRETNTLRALSL